MTTPDEAQRLAPAAITLWRIQRIIRLLTFGIPLMIALGVFAASTLPTPVILICVSTLILINVVFAIFWPALEYDAFRYALRENDLLVQSGVVFRRWSSIPNNRIQHVDTRQGPLERLLGLSRLLVYTAAGMSADGSIPGLSTDDAERLRDLLSRRGGDDGV